VDRDHLIADVLGGRGTPAIGAVSPFHWAYDSSNPGFVFNPDLAASLSPRRFTILIVEPSHERLALSLERQLQSAGMEVDLQQISLDEFGSRSESGDFDAILLDAVSGPTLFRPALWWHSRGPLNWGGYKSASVDAALDAINRAPDDAAYRAGVAAFQRAIVDDPPAIFLAWSERARAVSTRFEVPVEPGRDILSTLRLWRPVAPVATN
jgi:ABC-type transport system substrate-binding protein